MGHHPAPSAVSSQLHSNSPSICKPYAGAYSQKPRRHYAAALACVNFDQSIRRVYNLKV
jgi:hypothetical protein